VKLEGINGATVLFGIIGDPVAAVRSPEVFNSMFTRENLNAVFIPIHVHQDDLAAAWAGLTAIRNLRGIVVTMPHKLRIASFLDVVGDTGKFTGAVNAVKRDSDGRWFGEMFDGHGFVAGLRDQGHEPRNWKVSLHGLGGAGSAIAFALAQAGVKSLCLNDVDSKKSAAISRKLQAVFPALELSIGSAPLAELDAVINATPSGMNPSDPLVFDPSDYPPRTLVVDVITKPEMTPLLDLAARTGHNVHTGKHMHLGQARLAAQFFGFEGV